MVWNYRLKNSRKSLYMRQARENKVEDEKGYQGWANYETWCAKLWIDNSEGDYNYWREAAEEEIDAATESMEDGDSPGDMAREASYQLSKILEDELAIPVGLPDSDMYADLMSHAVGMVDWYEIASAMIEDAKE